MTLTTKRVVQWIFYGGFTFLLVLIASGLLKQMLPGNMTTRVSYNSEGYLFAVALGAWIQFGLTRLRPSQRLPWALGIGAFWAVVGLGLLASDLPSRIRTLNEGALGLAFVIPYVTLPRSVRRWLLWTVPVMVVLTVWAVVWAPESWIIDHAETFGFVALAMLTFDVFDRTLLEPGAVVSRGRRIGWYAFMVLEPVVVSGLGVAVRDGDSGIALALRYLGRIHESFVGVLLVALIIYLTRPRTTGEPLLEDRATAAPRGLVAEGAGGDG